MEPLLLLLERERCLMTMHELWQTLQWSYFICEIIATKCECNVWPGLRTVPYPPMLWFPSLPPAWPVRRACRLPCPHATWKQQRQWQFPHPVRSCHPGKLAGSCATNFKELLFLNWRQLDQPPAAVASVSGWSAVATASVSPSSSLTSSPGNLGS